MANDAPASTCGMCRRKLRQGVDAYAVQQGVMGMHGFIRLETLLFCSEHCLREYYNGNEKSPQGSSDSVEEDERVP